MENITLSLFDPATFIAVGIVLMATEALFFSFFLFWFGVSFVVVGILSHFDIFSNGYWQLSVVSTLSMILIFTLKAKATQYFLKARGAENNDTFLDEEGTGVIKNNMVYYKATYWKMPLSSIGYYKDGETVKVLSAKRGEAQIEKIDKIE